MTEQIGTWPAASTQSHTWRVSGEVADFLGPRRTQNLDGHVYTSTVPATIADLEPDAIVSRATLRVASDALQELAFFAERTSHLPPFMAGILLRSESASSSQIENLSTSARRLAEAELGLDVPQNARLVSANTRAMKRALEHNGPITAHSIMDIHRDLMADAPRVKAGAWRSVPVWIGGSHYAPINARFVGSAPDLIPAAVDDLAAFLACSSSNAISLAAIAHAQFETIHPFEDGNGRVGRALIHMVLNQQGYGGSATAPLSAGLLTHDTRRYFEALDHYRDGNIDAITLVVAEASMEATAVGLELATRVQDLRDQWRDQLRARSDSSVWCVLDTLLTGPVTSIPHLREQLGISSHAAMRALQNLAENSIVEQSVRDRHQQTWRAPQMLALLDDFAAGLPRR